jgi:hypothetical protein
MKTAIMVILTLMLLAGAAYAADYSTHMTDELLMMRGTMYDATIGDRTAFHTELSKRIAAMTPEQRQAVTGRPAFAGMGMGRRGMGRGMGYAPYCPFRTY